MKKQRLFFASGNPHKIKEVQAVLGDKLSIGGLDELNCTKDLPETHDTLRLNALEKAYYVADNFGVNCFSEDTGLEVMALNGEPGVYSARYAGDTKDADANIALVLQKMNGIENRKAQFRTVIALIWEQKEYLFEGIVQGALLSAKRGTGGFGYDPIFVPDGYSESFAELPPTVKNQISHRAKAVDQLKAWIEQHLI